MLSKLVLLLIRKLKKDDSYKFKKNIGSKDLLIILLARATAFLRGLIFCLFFLRKFKILFKGKGSSIHHSSKLSFKSPLTIGENVSINCLGSNGIEFGSNVHIPDGSIIRCTGVISELGVGLKIGNNTGLGHNTFMNAQGGIKIGDDVIVGPNTSFLAENHVFSDPMIPIRKQGVSRKGITIGSNTWIGSNVTILDGVEIGKGVVIGAGSLVTKSIPDNCIAFGSPCAISGKRNSLENEN